MTVAISNTGNNQTFGYWLNRTNEIAYALSVYAVTANGSNAAVGNASITGQFNANTLNLAYSANLGTYMVIGPWSSNPEANSAYVNTTHMSVGNVSVNSVVNSTSIKTYSTVYVGSNVVVNTSQVFIGESITNTSYDKWHIVFQGNTTVNATANSTTIQITNNAISSVLTFDTLWVGNSVINATMITTANVSPTGFTANTTTFMLGPNVYANNTTLVLGYTSTSNVLSNSTFVDVRSPSGNIKINSVLISLANSSSIANLTSDYLRIGNSFVNSTIMTTAYANGMGGGFTANTTAIVVGDIASPVQSISAYSNVTAILGESNSYIGVIGKSNSYYGIYGISNSGVGVVGVSTSSWGGYFVGAIPLYAGNSSLEFFRVNSDSHVGIGTTSPGTYGSLAVIRNINNSSTARIHIGNANTGSTAAAMLTLGNDYVAGAGVAGLKIFSGAYTGVGNEYEIFNNIGPVNITAAGVSGLYCTTTGVVGIGTKTPAYGKLHIIKDSNYGSESTSGICINSSDASGATELLLGADATSNLAYIQAVSRAVTYTKNLGINPNGGNVGVGNNNPLHKLSVNGVGFFNDNLVTLGELHANHASLAAARLFIAGTERGKIAANSSNYLMLDTNGTTRVFIDGSGNTGIGNSAPADKLSVNGTTYLQGIVTAAANVNVTNYVNAAVHSVGSNFIANAAGIYHTGTANLNTLTVGSNSATVTAITGYSNTAYGVYGISMQSPGVIGSSNTSYGVYGISNSAVGVVGQSTSNYGGYFISTSGISLFAGNNTTEFFRVTPTGNVGVGSTSATDSKFRVYDSTTLAGIRISYAGSSRNYYDANTHYFRDTGSNIRVTANTTGVGIGNTTFTDRLAVGGSVYFDSTLQVVTSVNSAAHTVGTATIANATGVYTTGTVNAAVQSVGFFVIANTSGVYVSNSVNSNTVRIGASSVNTSVNSTAFFATNGTQTTTINATSISTNANINGTGNVDIGSGVAGSAYANVRGDMFVRGNLQVSGNLAYTGVATGDIVPFGNTYNLGSSTNRWGIWGAAINASGTITASQNITVNTSIFLGDGISTTQITITPPNITQRNHGNTYLNANGSWTALPTIPVTNNVVITSGTTQQTIDSITLGTYAYDYVIHVSDTSGNRMATKILVSTNSSAINSSEYAQIGNLGSFTTDISAGSGYLYFTPSVSSTTVRFTKVQSS